MALFLLFFAWKTFLCVSCHFYIPDLPAKRYVKPGDLNIGAIFPIYNYDKVKPCGNQLRSTVILQFIEAFVFAIEQINDDNAILPQATLGFVIVDDCLKETTTIAQSLSFLPQPNTCTCNDTCSSNNRTATPAYDVIGVVGSMKSSNSIAAATLLGPAHVPQISYASSSDELSDKTLYPYFLRVVPPDTFQVEGIVSLIEKFGWSYVSVVYAEGSYGELGFKNLKQRLEERGMCIGTSHKVAEGSEPSEYDKVALELKSHGKVVVVFAGPTHARQLFSAVKRASDLRRYIWIGSDGWAKRIKNLAEFWEVGLGAFTFTFYSEEVPGFTKWFQEKDPLSEKDPWFKEFWERQFACSFDPANGKLCDASMKLSPSNFKPVSTATPVMDAALTFAHAAHALLQESCPERNGSDARDCITGSGLLDQIKKLSFMGNNGRVSFDENGNLLGRYMVEQLVREGDTFTQNPVGVYDSRRGILEFLFNNKITWDYVYRAADTDIPESVCSKPCLPGEFFIQKEPRCCWECKKCRENEYIVQNGTNCAPCPLYWWPDVSTKYKSCIEIKPTFLLWEEPLSIMLLFFSSLGVIATTIVFVLYIRFNSSKCIKASSREMSYLMLVGLFLGFVTVAILISPPSWTSCQIGFFCFCISFSWIYSPLLTRTSRIFRIFESSKRSTKRPKLVSPKSQVIIASGLILIQVAICIAITLIHAPSPKLSMPVRTERYVEQSCDFTLPGLASFLSYNLVLVVVCCFFAVKTRKLPDNFNESRFISMCVYTTLVLWSAFIPSYFTADRQYLKTVMLSIVLILNNIVALCFLYLPKIYAAMYLETKTVLPAGSTRFGRPTTVTNISSNTERNANFIQVQPVST
ncbi:metabotropic glutamate receptor 4-like [Haliotis asinina]|uniref:metabotropic glutamate receptor 4-like n=1 Tax=Haliotis asinina TaxID=109174 RepID=UPI003531FD77